MYRQILVHPSDRNFQRIFWFNSSGQPCPYQLTTVTYGLNCASFLALRVLQQLISDEGHQAQEIMTQVIQLCKAGGFSLQKWNSNYSALLDSPLSQENHIPAVNLDSTRTKVLGISIGNRKMIPLTLLQYRSKAEA